MKNIPLIKNVKDVISKVRGNYNQSISKCHGHVLAHYTLPVELDPSITELSTSRGVGYFDISSFTYLYFLIRLILCSKVSIDKSRWMEISRHMYTCSLILSACSGVAWKRVMEA